jgi:hypothetical protein
MGLKVIFSKQLPNMPHKYICWLLLPVALTLWALHPSSLVLCLQGAGVEGALQQATAQAHCMYAAALTCCHY